MRRGKQNRTYVISVLILAAIAGGALYMKGLGGEPRPGSLEITIPDSGSQVFLDNKKKTTTIALNQKIVFNRLTSRVHTILVNTPGNYPWYKAFDLSKETSSALTSFSIHTDLKSMDVPATDPQFQPIKTLIAKDILPQTTAKKISASGNVALWVDTDSNSVHAEWIRSTSELPSFFCPLGACSPHIIAFNGKAPIRSLDFFKNRDDVIIIAIENTISALELSISPPQNFQPIFTGTSPRFHQPESGILFIESGRTISVLRY